MKKVKDMDPHPFASSENALLAEMSFITGQDKQSVPNGNHRVWTEKMPKSMSAPEDIHAEVGICLLNYASNSILF